MSEPIPLMTADAVQITSLVDNTVDIFMPSEGVASREAFRVARLSTKASALLAGGHAPDQLVAEHGFSMLIDLSIGEHRHRVLFDAGVSPDGLIENMRRLDIAPDSIEAIVLSHGHFDHTTGLDGLARAMRQTNLPVLIHPEFWNRRRIRLPGLDPWELPSTSRSALEGVGFEVIEQTRPSFLFQGSMLVTGEIERIDPLEQGFPPQQAWRDGAWLPDPLVLDDQGIVIDVAGKGLVIITGCGHAGIINTIHQAQRLTGTTNVHAVFGGFHLNGPLFEPLIPHVCDTFRTLEPDVIVPSHCTGWKALTALAHAFPGAFLPNSVGTVYRL